jgi:large subunit ribosomal protein L25
MSQPEVIHVKIRQSRGKHQARRMRAHGEIPAVLYGHGQATESLTVPAAEIEALLRHGGKVVQLQGDVNGSALVREVQWDGLGSEVLHLDLTRVSSTETVDTTVRIELRGDAPGTREGGILEHALHTLEIRCPVASIPDRLLVNVNALGLGESITVGDLELPAGAVPVPEPHELVVQCVAPAEVPEEEEVVAAGAAEPEVIGRREGEAEEGEREN